VTLSWPVSDATPEDATTCRQTPASTECTGTEQMGTAMGDRTDHELTMELLIEMHDYVRRIHKLVFRIAIMVLILIFSVGAVVTAIEQLPQ
jgi:hypothetical protein